MALPFTLHDFEIALSHVDRGLDLKLTVRTARHPSETMERVWLRVLAYCLFHEERLAFGPGLGEPEAPDLQADDLTGRLTRWIRVGKADPAKVQRAADQNADAKVAVLFESPAKLEAFLSEARAAGLSRLGEVELVAADPELVATLGAKDGRRAKLSLTLVGDHAYLDVGGTACDGPLTRGSAG
ncbi:MAG TPA: YaeQ family protein [Myxococcales bacterium]|jgi:uncharacterized protein YaeQ